MATRRFQFTGMEEKNTPESELSRVPRVGRLDGS